jgi:hypothetical protein
MGRGGGSERQADGTDRMRAHQSRHAEGEQHVSEGDSHAPLREDFGASSLSFRYQIRPIDGE